MWVRLDDRILEHPKVLAVGPKGFVLYVASLTFSSRLLTDGFIPKAKLYTLVPWLSRHEAVASAQALLGARLWARARHDGMHGYRIHDYLDYNPSKAVVLHDRKNTARRVRAHREGRRGSPSGNEPGNTVSNTRPVPVPVPVPLLLKDLHKNDDQNQNPEVLGSVARRSLSEVYAEEIRRREAEAPASPDETKERGS